jgi:hypothetical protein
MRPANFFCNYFLVSIVIAHLATGPPQRLFKAVSFSPGPIRFDDTQSLKKTIMLTDPSI